MGIGNNRLAEQPTLIETRQAFNLTVAAGGVPRAKYSKDTALQKEYKSI
jgi:hypothetical protein